MTLAATLPWRSTTTLLGITALGITPLNGNRARPPSSKMLGYGTLNLSTNALAEARLSRVLIPTNRTPRSACCRASRTRSGVSARQGPHHDPQTLITTILPAQSESRNESPSRVVPSSSGAFVRLVGAYTTRPGLGLSVAAGPLFPLSVEDVLHVTVCQARTAISAPAARLHTTGRSLRGNRFVFIRVSTRSSARP